MNGISNLVMEAGGSSSHEFSELAEIQISSRSLKTSLDVKSTDLHRENCKQNKC